MTIHTLQKTLAALLLGATLGAAPAHDRDAAPATPTDVLKHEHRVVERVADALDAMADETEKDGRLEAKAGAEVVDFLKGFLDKCHHAKEERLLFAALEEQGTEARLVRTLRGEHDEGRAHARAMTEAVKTAGKTPEASARSFAVHARAYTKMLREHIEKEDGDLFPAADRTLTGETQHRLAREFDRVETEETGQGVHEKYVGIAEELEARYGTAPEPAPHEAPAHSHDH